MTTTTSHDDNENDEDSTTVLEDETSINLLESSSSSSSSSSSRSDSVLLSPATQTLTSLSQNMGSLRCLFGPERLEEEEEDSSSRRKEPESPRAPTVSAPTISSSSSSSSLSSSQVSSSQKESMKETTVGTHAQAVDTSPPPPPPTVDTLSSSSSTTTSPQKSQTNSTQNLLHWQPIPDHSKLILLHHQTPPTTWGMALQSNETGHARVSRVDVSSAAERAGIQVGDVLCLVQTPNNIALIQYNQPGLWTQAKDVRGILRANESSSDAPRENPNDHPTQQRLLSNAAKTFLQQDTDIYNDYLQDLLQPPSQNTEQPLPPFCKRCHGASTRKHHSWCRHYEFFETSGAQELLQRIQQGREQLDCAACAQEYQSGKLLPGLQHGALCLENQECLKRKAKGKAIVQDGKDSKDKKESSTITPQKELTETKEPCAVTPDARSSFQWITTKDNPWGPSGHEEGDVLLYHGGGGGSRYHYPQPHSPRFVLHPFAPQSTYWDTHQCPQEGLTVVRLRRDALGRRPWGWDWVRDEFGHACLVSAVDVASPASVAVCGECLCLCNYIHVSHSLTFHHHPPPPPHTDTRRHTQPIHIPPSKRHDPSCQWQIHRWYD